MLTGADPVDTFFNMTNAQNSAVATSAVPANWMSRRAEAKRLADSTDRRERLRGLAKFRRLAFDREQRRAWATLYAQARGWLAID